MLVPVHLAGTSGRGRGLPTMVYVEGSLSGALGSIFRSKRRSPIKSAKEMPAPPAFGRTWPSTATRSSGLLPRRCAASSISALRAVAAACLICTPPRWMPLDPDVRPCSRLTAVSPSAYLIFSPPIASPPAAICRMAIRKPRPRSTLPQNTVTVPSPFTAKKPSPSFGSRMRGELPPSCAKRSSPRPLNAKAMVSAPPLRTARRDTRGGLMGTVISASRTRRRHDGSDNSDVSAAAAQSPIERGANFVFGGLGCLGEQRNGTHDHTARAVAALRHLLFNEGGLDRVR